MRVYPLYDEVATLDQRCYEKYQMSEELLMEHAAMGLKRYVDEFPRDKKVVIIAGCGNNGADGLALARMLQGERECCVYAPFGVKSSLAILQKKRCEAVGVKFINTLEEGDVIVDALFGSGYVPRDDSSLVAMMNSLRGFKIACDIPTGLGEAEVFKADVTVTMGGAKKILFEDFAKDVTGKISVASLGISSMMYQQKSDVVVLEQTDLRLPYRMKHNTHKGDFGHLACIAGDKKGAAWLCAKAAVAFGAGLVSIIGENEVKDPQVMIHDDIPEGLTALVIGMGLGAFSKEELLSIWNLKIPLVVDADVLHAPFLRELILNRENIILTPHPKEFVVMLHHLLEIEIDVLQLQKERFKYAQMFSDHFPSVTLVLKGANTIIAHDKRLWVNPLGVPALAKGGSGDVLAGMIGALLAQRFSSCEAAIQGSMAHALSAAQWAKNDFSFSPLKIIEGLETLR